MITMLGSPRRTCDGVTRRETLAAGALTLLGGGFTLPKLLAAESSKPATARPGKAKNVILLYLLGGAADAGHVRLEARRAGRGSRRVQADRTRPRGMQICEHLPRTSTVDAQGRHRALGEPQGRVPQLPAELHRLSNNRCRTSTRATPTRRAWARVRVPSRRPRRPARLRLPAVLARLGAGVPPRRAVRGVSRQRYDPLTPNAAPTPTRARTRSPGKPRSCAACRCCRTPRSKRTSPSTA